MMARKRFIIVAVLRYFATILVAFTINFAVPRLVPGDPIYTMLANMESTAYGSAEYKLIIDDFRRTFGLDKDWLTQYICSLQRLFVGDLGISIAWFPLKVSDLVFRALPWTIGLLSFTTLISWILGNILGAITGWFRRSKVVTSLTITAICFGSIPYYILAVVFVFLFVYLLNIFPLGIYELILATPAISLEYLLTLLRSIALPAITLIVSGFSGWLLTMRSMIISVMEEDYVRFAEAKGLKLNVIFMKYAFRNALLPQVTGLGISMGWIVSGALITETIFGFPGLGTLLYDAITRMDYNVIQGITLLVTFSVSTATLILDLVYPLLDPRIKYERV